MIDLEPIKELFKVSEYWRCRVPAHEALILHTRDLVEEVERLREALDPVQPCGHKRSAIIGMPDDISEICPMWCGECEAEDEAEVRRDDRLNTNPEVDDVQP